MKRERVRELVKKEFRQIRRDPRLARMILMAPMLQLIVFGYAVSTDVRHTHTFLVDHDQSAASRELVEAFTAPGYFDVVGRSSRPADLTRALDHGKAVMGLEIPPDFAQALGRGNATVQLVFDGTNSNLTTVALGYAERIVQSFGARVEGEPPGGIDLRARAWFNPDLISRNYNVPAVVGLVVLVVCLLLTSLAVVREREIGTLEQLMVSPITPGELIAGKTIPFAAIGFLDLSLVTTIAVLWFHVPFVGSLLTFLGASALYLLSALGVGLLISTVSSTQREAFLATFLVFQPTILLSGFMFPVSSMPAVFQWLTLVNPMRHYLVIARSVFLKGTPVNLLWPPLLALALIGGVIFWLATRRFHKVSA